MFVINDTLGVYGGSHTLMLRMCKWLNENGIRSAVLCRSDSNMEIVEKIRKYGTEVICVDVSDALAGAKVLQRLMDTEEISVMSFSWNYYLDIERIKKKYKLQFNHFIYCIHPDTFKKGDGFKHTWLRRYSARSYRSIYERMNENYAVVHMDEINIEESKDYLGIKLSQSPPIIPLPMYCKERSDADVLIQKGFDSNVLLTAARADFPYKGYILGLIDDFSSLKREFPDMLLEIITSGDDIDQVYKKLDEQPAEIVKDIHIRGWMEYGMLLQEMESCRLFIGMGTSVLDAALVYRPACAVKYDTLENISDHLIADAPGLAATKKGIGSPAINIIRDVFGWSESRYKRECKRSFTEVQRIYDIDECMQRFIEVKTRQKTCILSGYECIRHHLNNKLNRIRFGERINFSYDAIRKDNE